MPDEFRSHLKADANGTRIKLFDPETQKFVETDAMFEQCRDLFQQSLMLVGGTSVRAAIDVTSLIFFKRLTMQHSSCQSAHNWQ